MDLSNTAEGAPFGIYYVFPLHKSGMLLFSTLTIFSKTGTQRDDMLYKQGSFRHQTYASGGLYQLACQKPASKFCIARGLENTEYACQILQFYLPQHASIKSFQMGPLHHK